MKKVYTSEMIKFLKDNSPSYTIKSITDLFNKEFNTNITTRRITETLYNYKISYKKRKLELTPRMIDTLKELAIKHKGIETITDLFNKEFNTNLSHKNIYKAMVLRNIKYTHIRNKGNEIGAEFTSKKNGTFIKFTNDGKNKYDNWILKHHFIWEQAHGKIPENYRIIFLDNNKQNFELENLECVSKIESILLKKYGFHTNNKEVTKTGLAIVRHRLATLKAMTKGMNNEDEKQIAMRKFYNKQRYIKNAN